MINIFSTLGFGLLLGIKHAFEADHLIAVSTILTGQKSTRKAALVGTFWGIGHTTTLFIVGLCVLILRLSIPEPIAQKLEVLVGIMLVVLGIQNLIKKTDSHTHEHKHDALSHTHMHHSHQHQHQHGKSFIIGMVHGLAGSGALMVLVLSLINSIWQGVVYILLFGFGSTVSMTIMSLLIGVPLSKSLTVFNKAEKYIRIVAGTISIVFGIFIIFTMLH
jgi:cytochrome c biogenesis protein CcdA